jgi:hypothetical protein
MSDRVTLTPTVVRNLKFPTGSHHKHLTVWDDEVKYFLCARGKRKLSPK